MDLVLSTYFSLDAQTHCVLGTNTQYNLSSARKQSSLTFTLELLSVSETCRCFSSLT